MQLTAVLVCYTPAYARHQTGSTVIFIRAQHWGCSSTLEQYIRLATLSVYIRQATPRFCTIRATPGRYVRHDTWECVQAQEVQRAAPSSLQACITTAVQAGKGSTAVAAAEEVAACLGRLDAQAAAEAILMAQSARAVEDLEALYREAAGPQVAEVLVLTGLIVHA